MNKVATRLIDLAQYVPEKVLKLKYSQKLIPKIARDIALVRAIETAAQQVPSKHTLYCADSRQMDFLTPESVHLIVTSPPYWTLKEYDEVDGQLGYVRDYEDFLRQLDQVWAACFRALVPGGRLVCVVGEGHPELVPG